MQFWFEENGKVVDWDLDCAIGTCRVVGKTSKINPISGQEYSDVDIVEVNLFNGDKIMCTRLGPDYCLVQESIGAKVIIDLATGKENRVN